MKIFIYKLIRVVAVVSLLQMAACKGGGMAGGGSNGGPMGGKCNNDSHNRQLEENPNNGGFGGAAPQIFGSGDGQINGGVGNAQAPIAPADVTNTPQPDQQAAATHTGVGAPTNETGEHPVAPATTAATDPSAKRLDAGAAAAANAAGGVQRPVDQITPQGTAADRTTASTQGSAEYVPSPGLE